MPRPASEPSHLGENAREISYDAFSRVPSATAANASKPLFGPSGAMDYRVVLLNGSAQTAIRVNAVSGDDAAARALASRPGMKVGYVGPATGSDAVPAIDPEAIAA